MSFNSSVDHHTNPSIFVIESFLKIGDLVRLSSLSHSRDYIEKTGLGIMLNSFSSFAPGKVLWLQKGIMSYPRESGLERVQ